VPDHDRKARLLALWDRPHTIWGWFTSVDHKDVGKRYLVTAFLFLLVGGIEAILIRLQLARPDAAVLTPEAYDQIFTMHGMTMIFWYASPILSGFANYLIPMMGGMRDMAYPRLNAFTYWTFLASGLFLYGSPFVGQAPHGGWFAYVPYTNAIYSPGLNMDFYALALLFLTISTTAGAINFITTILRLRAPGMAVSRMPLFFYSTLTVSASVIVALPPLTVACVFLELDRRWGTHFFDVNQHGSVLLWQQLFWFFGHPWVYIIFLPATGMISMIIPTFARRPIVGYPYVALATVLTGVVGFGVWVHHMFATGEPQMAMSFFSAASMTISIFSAVQVFAWVATLATGAPVLTTSMLFAVGFLVVFVIGGLNGIVTAVIPFDWQLTDTYFVVSHLHYVLVGANMFPVFAGFYYWLPKITGRMLDERLGKWSFWVMFTGFNLVFFPMQIVGILGMPRRIYTYPASVGWGSWNMAETIGAFILGVGILLSIVNFFISLHGEHAGCDPWQAGTLEWESQSPPEVFGSAMVPIVASRFPLWDEFDEHFDPEDDRALDHQRVAAVSTVLDADPIGIAKMADDTATPLYMAVALTVLFTALLLKAMWVALGATLMTLLIAAVWLWPEPERVIDRANVLRKIA
jgi:cytochrome c oxidase subunit I